MALFSRKTELPRPEDALPGRAEPIPVPERHAVLDAPLTSPYPEGTEVAEFALGCFWGPEREFWGTAGVVSTAVGYAGGFTPNPTYEEVCTGQTGHAEAVRVVYEPSRLGYRDLLKMFWEGHDPTQGMRQGGDIGTQYRSMIFVRSEEERLAAEESREKYQQVLQNAGYGEITTEIVPAGDFYFAEDYHQQFLHKNPAGYCGVGGTGLACPVGVVPAEE